MRAAVAAVCLITAGASALARDGRTEQVVHEAVTAVPELGPPDALVTVELFANLHDGRRSGTFVRRLDELRERHPRRLRVVVYVSETGALNHAALEAHAQGRFAEFLAAVYAEAYPKSSSLDQYALAAGLDLARVHEAVSDERHVRSIYEARVLRSRRGASRVVPLAFNGAVPEQLHGSDDYEAAYDDAYTRARALADREGLRGDALFHRLAREAAAARLTPRFARGRTDRRADRIEDGDGAALPSLLAAPVRTTGGRGRGPAVAPVVLRLFCTPASRHCRGLYRSLRELQREYGGELRVVVEYLYDRELHPDAPVAHQASLCADDQGRYWEVVDDLYGARRETDLRLPQILERAERLVADLDAFTECLQTGRYVGVAEGDAEAARAAGIVDTPTLVVNGRVYVGTRTQHELHQLVELEMAPGLLERADELRGGVLSAFPMRAE